MRLRSVPEDFRVEEIPLYEPSGVGDHTFVCVEKRLRTTEDVARSLARVAGVSPRDVGYAGRKDRDAVTRQWFSLPALDPERARAIDLPGLRVLDAVRHPHKLRTGQLAGNRFRIVVRDIDAAACAAAAQRLEQLCLTGMPNRFGPQRFGRDGDNALRAQRFLRGERVAGDRRELRFLVSALQASVFNAILAARSTPLDSVELGEVAMVHASGGSFIVEDLAREQARALAFEISATGPIFGTRLLEGRGDSVAREHRAFADQGVDLENLRVPRGLRLRGSRRAVRVRPEDASACPGDEGLILSFTLPPGSYATVLMEELLGATVAEEPAVR